jgi:hypothetical protein
VFHRALGGFTILLLAGSSACSGPKRLETSLGGRRAESLTAEARKIDGRWQVELLLPAGHWRVETQEGQAVQVLPGEPRSTLRWVVDSDRWSQQDRPFRFTLTGEGGLGLSMSVRYPNTLPRGLVVLLEVLTGRVGWPS